MYLLYKELLQSNIEKMNPALIKKYEQVIYREKIQMTIKYMEMVINLPNNQKGSNWNTKMPCMCSYGFGLR